IDGTAPPPLEPEVGKRIFVSSGTQAGTDGTTAFDSLCESEGGDLTLRALVATTATVPAQTLSGGPWVRPDRVTVLAAGNKSKLVAPIDVTADMQYLVGEAWTGSGLSTMGTASTTCSNWSIGGTSGAPSDATHTLDGFSAAVTTPCVNQKHIYCIEP